MYVYIYIYMCVVDRYIFKHWLFIYLINIHMYTHWLLLSNPMVYFRRNVHSCDVSSMSITITLSGIPSGSAAIKIRRTRVVHGGWIPWLLQRALLFRRPPPSWRAESYPAPCYTSSVSLGPTYRSIVFTLFEFPAAPTPSGRKILNYFMEIGLGGTEAPSGQFSNSIALVTQQNQWKYDLMLGINSSVYIYIYV